MSWKIWQKTAKQDEQKKSGPSPIPEPVARYMVVDLQTEAEWVCHLKAVVRSRVDIRHVYDFRVFEAHRAMAGDVQVRDFTSLDGHPELIVLQGAYNRKSGDVWAERPISSERLRAA